MRLGIAQVGSTADKYGNVMRLASLIRGEPDLVVAPEYLMTPISGLPPAKVYEAAETIEGRYVDKLARVASEYSTWMVGHMFERASYPKVYNTALLIDPGGNVKAAYRKMHLFDAFGYRESDYMEPGDTPSPIVRIGDVNVAIAICFELRFPELFRLYALRGADLIVVPTAWYRGPLKEEMLSLMARARAHENTVFVAVADQYGPEFVGRSMLVDPLGVVMADLGIGERYVELRVDPSAVAEARKSLPLLDLVRSDIVMSLLGSIDERKGRH